MAYGDKGVKASMKAADRSGAPVVVIVGDDDAAAGVAQVKDMATGEQVPVRMGGRGRRTWSRSSTQQREDAR